MTRWIWMAKVVAHFYEFCYTWRCTIILHYFPERCIFYSDILANVKKFYRLSNKYV